MSRQAGGQVGGAGAGMGSRGPGETKIELDRRRIHTRMARLRKQIEGMKPAREAKRANRKRNAVPSVAIAGYTNAGKSSLLNRITGAGVLVENALFATLDADRAAQHHGRRPRVHDRRHRRLRAQPAAPARRGVPVDARGGRRRRPDRARRRRGAPRPRRPDRHRARRHRRGRRPRRARARRVQQGRPRRPPTSASCCAGSSPTRSSSPRAPARASTRCSRRSRGCCPTPPSRSTCSCRTTAATSSRTLHETGRVLSIEYVEDGTRIRALASPEQAAQLAEFAAASVTA